MQNKKYSISQKLPIALLIGYIAPIILIILGPLELYWQNNTEFPFGVWDYLIPAIILTILAGGIIALFLMIFNGKAFGIISSIVFGLTLAAYIQGTFLNKGMEILTGDVQDFSKYNWYKIPNALIWLLIIAIPVVIYLWKPKAWTTIIKALPAIIFGMQVASTTAILLRYDYPPKTSAYMSTKGMYQVSSKDNILVFIIDRLDEDYINKVKQKQPDFFDELDGFTQYTNHTSVYCRTYPSVVYMLAGDARQDLFKYDMPSRQYFDESYAKTKFLPTLKKNNYTTKIYSEMRYACLDANQLAPIADNIRVDGIKKVKTMNMMAKMLNFSAFRYSPHALQPMFLFSYETFARTVEIAGNEHEVYNQDDFDTYNKLKQEKLEVIDDKNNFMFLHLTGSHPPYSIDSNMEKLTGDKALTIDVVEPTIGSFKLIYEYLNQLKEKGLYENSTIIITGDHGEMDEKGEMMDKQKLTALFVKPKGSQGTALTQSNKPISHQNFQASVIQAAGIDSSQFGKTYDDIKQDDDVLRKFMYKIDNKEGSHKRYLEEYNITGDANDFANWKHVESHLINEAFNH